MFKQNCDCQQRGLSFAALYLCAVAGVVSFFSWPDIVVAEQQHSEEQKTPPSSSTVVGRTSSAINSIIFEKHIAPIFATKCMRCHGNEVQKSELNLATAAGVLKGGDGGGAIVAGKPEESLLYEYIESDQMPPEEVKDPKLRLTADEKKLIHDWISSGAKFDSHDPVTKESGKLTEDDVIYPVLANCTVCHGLRKQEAGLSLVNRDAMLRGGRSGPVIVPGHPEQSLLLKRIHAGEMPPNRKLVEFSVKPMEPTAVEALAKWIEQGALPSTGYEDVATTEPDTQVSDTDRKFWAFQPPKPVAPPRIHASGIGGEGTEIVQNPIDAFLLEKLQVAGLSLAPEADLRTLVRRAYFDLTGLPPTVDEMNAVLKDADPRAYEKLIDRLLESPRYGERWGRYWLDLAGYADSEGTTDQDAVRPFAYRYRDYVIRSFNADKPHDRFLMEQLAGDELADYENAPEITQEIYDNLVATGFLRMAPDGTLSSTNNFVGDRLMVIADEMQVIGSSILGLTIQCARCHSHKFDPIPQRDYYRMLAALKPAQDEHDWLTPQPYPLENDLNNPPRPMEVCRFLPHVPADELEPIQRHNEPIQRRIAAIEAEKNAAADNVRKQLLQERLSELNHKDRDMLAGALETAADARSDMQRVTIDAMAERLNIDDETLRSNAEYAAVAKKLDKQIDDLKKKLKPTPFIRAAWDRGTVSPTYILRRGEPYSPTRRVGPGVLSVLTDGRTPFEVTPPWEGAKTTGRRLAFAKWLTRPDHPLTARVMVNRIWMHHFGRGIVTTPDNFGKTGSPPSHPELLDWLAIEFVQRGWSIKAMHRLMMTSATYRQSSAVTEEQLTRDPDNAIFSRMPLRRLDAESVRDSILLVSGRLDETQFGPPDEVHVRPDGLVTVRSTDRGWRRSIYALQRRTQLPTLLESFDLPQMSPNCVERPRSTVAPQALQLLNDGQIHGLAKSLAKRVAAEAGTDLRSQVERLFSIALGRLPRSDETELALSSLDQLTSAWLKHHREIEIESSTETWIRESAPTQRYENDLIYVHSRKGTDRARRTSLIEFDLKRLRNVKILSARLELSPVQSAMRVRQQALLVPPGIEETTWQTYQDTKAVAEQPLEALGAFDLTTNISEVGKYCVGQPASAGDLEKLRRFINGDGRVAFALTAVEDGGRYLAEWDDGEGPGTNGKKPRLVVRCESLDEDAADAPLAVVEQARMSALANLCHAILNSPEFIYVD